MGSSTSSCTGYESCVRTSEKRVSLWRNLTIPSIDALEGKYLQVLGKLPFFFLAYKVIILSHRVLWSLDLDTQMYWTHTDESPDFHDFFFISFFSADVSHYSLGVRSIDCLMPAENDQSG